MSRRLHVAAAIAGWLAGALLTMVFFMFVGNNWNPTTWGEIQRFCGVVIAAFVGVIASVALVSTLSWVEEEEK